MTCWWGRKGESKRSAPCKGPVFRLVRTRKKGLGLGVALGLNAAITADQMS